MDFEDATIALGHALNKIVLEQLDRAVMHHEMAAQI